MPNTPLHSMGYAIGFILSCFALATPSLTFAADTAADATPTSPVEQAAKETANAFAECSGAYGAASAATAETPDLKNVTRSTREQADDALIAGAWSLYSNKVMPAWPESISYMETLAAKEQQEWILSINGAPNVAEVKQISARLGQKIISCARQYSSMQDALVAEARRKVLAQ